MNKKCIVLDLDNTLWGGVVGEDGLEGIKLGIKGEGASFIAFQQALLDLHDKGIILAINSKNNEGEALKVLREHPNMILKEKHFAGIRINWKDKAENILELAKEINIGTDSMVFLDDDPTNRALVRRMLPEVAVPDLPTESEKLVPFLLSSPYFNLKVQTQEDKMRGNLYVTERLRREKEKEFLDKKEFLSSLGLELHVYINDDEAIPRLAQLTEKTNQFNFNKTPLTEDELSLLLKDGDDIVLYGRVIDTFGDHGITNLAVIKRGKETWNVIQYLMSCRVIGKDIEDAFLHVVADLARKEGVGTLTLSFNKTEKNIPAQEFVSRLGGNTTVLTSNIKEPKTVKIILK